MQIKEFEAYTLKECLQQVRNELGPEAVILETRKFRKGGVMGWGAKDAVCIVAATGRVHDPRPVLRSAEYVRVSTVEPQSHRGRQQRCWRHAPARVGANHA